ncbi:hypothetical protein CYMTET_41474 [Cymbomonas tetramitiformis]|uniref:Staphylococcus aureus surface protein A n=1 Tax=Cymbomonas tetramitiformis TaxID=36881 RepID=A0AAE0C615_9CHLO|nr:hypothetical protein CYMTET_41474 [Cymbomonas tetramitiformis]
MTAAFTPAFGSTSTYAASTNSVQYAFSYPAPQGGNALFDDRPAKSLVCFYASDKYLTNFKCVELQILEIPKRPEQVLTRFGCHMGLLWNAAPAGVTGAPAGKFCFFDYDADFSLDSTVQRLCSDCSYQDYMWHHAVVSLDQDTGFGKLIVDGVVQKQFTTSWKAVMCEDVTDSSPSESTAGRRLIEGEQKDGTALAEVQGAGRSLLALPDNCQCEYRIAQSCDLKYSGFEGLVDEVGVWTAALSEETVSKLMFGLSSVRPIVAQDLCAGEAYDYKADLVAYYKFDLPCMAPVYTQEAVVGASADAPRKDRFGILEHYMEDSSHTGNNSGTLFSGYTSAIGGPYTYAATPYLAPTTVSISGPDGMPLDTVPVGSEIAATVEVTGAAPNPFLKCTTDMGVSEAHESPMYISVGGTYVSQWRMSDATVGTAESATTKGPGGKTYWQATTLTCNFPSAGFGEGTNLAVSNDGGLSRGDALSAVQQEMVLTLDGTAYVDASAVIQEITAVYTVGMWVYPSSATTEAYVLAFSRSSDSVTTAISYDPVQQAFTGIFEGNSMAGSPFAAPMDQWHYITLVTEAQDGGAPSVTDGTAATNAVFYVNGRDEGLGVGPFSPPPRDDEFFFGGYKYAATSHLVGHIDEVRVYNTNLEKADVLSEMWGRNLAFEQGLVLESLVGYYRMSGMGGTTMWDKGTGATSDATVVDDPTDATLGFSYAFAPVPWQPTYLSGGSRTCNEGNMPRDCADDSKQAFGEMDMVGPTYGGTLITITGANFAQSQYLSCVFGSTAEATSYDLPGYVAMTDDAGNAITCDTASQVAPRARTDGVVSSLSVTQAGGISGVEMPATFIDSNTVTCMTPAVDAPTILEVSVVNKPAGEPNAIYGSGTFEFKETGLELDGEDDLVDASVLLADSGSLDAGLGQAYSVGLWVMLYTEDPCTVVAFEGVDGEGNLALIAFNGEHFYYYDDNILDAPVGSTEVAIGLWHYVLLDMRETGKGALYVDDGIPATFTTTSRPVVNGTLIFGAEHNSEGAPAHFLAGMLDEIKVYKESISEFFGDSKIPEIKWDIAGHADLSTYRGGLVGYYKFNDAVNTTAESFLDNQPAINVVGGYWVLSTGPWLPAMLYEATESAGTLNYNEPIEIYGANFAPSPWSRCFMGDAEVDCTIIAADTIMVTKPAVVTSDETVTFNVWNDGTEGSASSSSATFDHSTHVGDLWEGLTSWETLLGNLSARGEGRTAQPFQASPFAPHMPVATPFVASASASVAAWVKLNVMQPEDMVNLTGYSVGQVQAGSWKLVTLTSDGALFLGTETETDALKIEVYGFIGTELLELGMLSSRYTGMLDEVWYWDRPISAAEVSYLYFSTDYALDFTKGLMGSVELEMMTKPAQAFSFWIKPFDVQGPVSQTLLSTVDFDGLMQDMLGLTAGRVNLAFRLHCSTEPCSDYVEFMSKRAYVANHQWHHVSYNLNPQEVKVYVDGVLVADWDMDPEDMAQRALERYSSVFGMELGMRSKVLVGENYSPQNSSLYNGADNRRRFNGLMYNMMVQAEDGDVSGFSTCEEPTADVYLSMNGGVKPYLIDPASGRKVADLPSLEMWTPLELTDAYGYVSSDGFYTATSGTYECITVQLHTRGGKRLLKGGSPPMDFYEGNGTTTRADAIGGLIVKETFAQTDGTSAVCYTSDVCGEYTLSINNGELLRGIKIVPGALSPEMSLATGYSTANADQTHEQAPAAFTVTTRDAQGCVVDDPSINVTVNLYGPADLMNISGVYAGAGVYNLHYYPPASGEYYMEVYVQEEGGEPALVTGASLEVTHGKGNSVLFDGYGSIEVYEEFEGVSPLDLSDTSFTVSAWIKRGPEGVPPPPASPPNPPPNYVGCGEDSSQSICQPPPPAPGSTRHLLAHPSRHLQQFEVEYPFPDEGGIITGDKPIQYIMYKGGIEPHPHDDELTVLQYNRNFKGEYRKATSSFQTGLQDLVCEVNTLDPKCDSSTDEGWVHVAATYDGNTMKLYIDGVDAGEEHYNETKFGKPNMYYHPMSIGTAFAGQVDEARVYQEVLNFTDMGWDWKNCPMHVQELPGSLVASVPLNEGYDEKVTVFSATRETNEGLFKEPNLYGMRVRWAPPRSPSKVGVLPSARYTLITNMHEDYHASSNYLTGLWHVHVKDECDFTYPARAEVLASVVDPEMTVIQRDLVYGNFASDFFFFGTSQELGAEVTTPAQVTATNTGFKPGPYQVAFGITRAASYSVTVNVQGVEMWYGQVMKPGMTVAPARASLSQSAVLETYPALMGVPAQFYIQAKDSFANTITVGGEIFGTTSDTLTMLGEPLQLALGNSTMAQDAGDGTYRVQYFGNAVDVDGSTVSITLSTNPEDPDVDTSEQQKNVGGLIVNQEILDITLFSDQCVDGSTVLPNARVMHTAVTSNTSMLMFAGIYGNTDKQHIDELWKADLGGPHMYEQVNIELTIEVPSFVELGTLTPIEIDTTSSKMNNDCSDLRLLNGCGHILDFWINPQQGCNRVDTEVWINHTTSRIYMLYYAPQADVIFDAVETAKRTFGVYHGFEEGIPEDSSSECTERDLEPPPKGLFEVFGDASADYGKSLLVTDEHGRGEYSFDLTGAVEYMGSSEVFYLRAWFYDPGGDGDASLPGEQALVLQSADCQKEIILGLDSSPSVDAYKYYIAKSHNSIHYGFPNVTGSQEKEVRSRGWRLFEIFDRGTGDANEDGGIEMCMDQKCIKLLEDGGKLDFTDNNFIGQDVLSMVPGKLIIRVGLERDNKLPSLWDGIAFSAGGIVPPTRPTVNSTDPMTMMWPQNGGWQLTAPGGRVPPKRWAHSATVNVDVDSMVVMGGSRSSFAFNDIWQLDFETMTWSWTSPISLPGKSPSPRKEHSTVYFHDKIYVYGGRSATMTNEVYADVWEFDFSTQEWTDITTGNSLGLTGGLPALYGHSAVVHGGKMIIFGGYGPEAGGCTSDVYEYDFATRIYGKHTVAGTAVPEARYGHTAQVYQNKMNVLYGASDNFKSYNSWWQYDLREHTWTLLQGDAGTSTLGRYHHASTVVGDSMVMFGGRGNGQYSSNFKAYPLTNVGQY